MDAEDITSSFPLPSQIADVPGAEGWRSTYPCFTLRVARTIRWPPGSTSGSTPSRSRATARWNSAGKNRSPDPATTRIGMDGHAPKSQTDPKTASASGRWCGAPVAATSGGTSRCQYQAAPPAPGIRT